jgi:hypothetical protein
MSTAQVYRLSGLSLLIGAALSIICGVAASLAFPDSANVAAATNPLNIGLSLLSVAGTILALLGLPGLYARSAREGGLLWLIGVVLIAITGLLFGVFLGLMSVIVFPTLAVQAPDLFREGPPPSFFPLFIVATIANVLGALLMGMAMLSRSIFPRWCGYLMVLEAVLALVGFFMNGPSNTLVGAIFSAISPLPLFVVIGWGGYALWSEQPREANYERTGQAATQAV